MNIESLLKLRDLTQSELADMTGLSQSAISRAQNGDGSVTLRKFQQIAKVLQVPLASLFDEDRTRSENELLDTFRHLPADRQALWLEMSRTFARGQMPPTPEKL